ncbi:MAG: DNA photolyase family protein [Gammaproteobacteria bacterium]|nr:DNA photolyase family protein [Gammaproteobacteria bacterium]
MSATQRDTAIVWLRRDLRLRGNPALAHACSQHQRVVVVFILDAAGEGDRSPGAASLAWLHRSLQALDADLRQRHSALILRRGDSHAQLQRLIDDCQATAVYWNRRYEPAVRERDAAIKQWLSDIPGLQVQSFNASLWWEPWEISTGQGKPYRVFTPMWKNMLENWRAPRPEALPQPFPALTDAPASLTLDELALRPQQRGEPAWDDGFFHARQTAPYTLWQPGEQGAWQRLREFGDGALHDYKARRDVPASAGTSMLSPHLAWGEISTPQLVSELCPDGQPPADAMINSFVRELAWREFSWHLLYHFPHLPEQPLQPKFTDFPWREDDSALQRWQRGETGIPIVDAGMRQLWQHGWMHNRVRMLVASFLTKNLLLPWQAGERWFWDTLVDADLANNSQGWQWTAGCGADAAPYFRVFNPVTQGQRFDPDGDYVRCFVPALARLPKQYIHAPWSASADTLRQAGIEPGRDYPMPMVDLQRSRERALQAWQQIR